jgi:flagellin-like hook-associated protein FlgL
MSRIIPIPTTRVGDLFVRQRLIGQVQLDQLDLFRLQRQVSSGHRLELPSDDAPAALRAINLQRLQDRKGQIRTNVQSSEFYLSAAEDSIWSVSQLLNEIRAETIGVAGTLTTDEGRQTVVQQIDQALRTLMDTGNAKSQGRYLFAGSRSTVQPYDFNGQYVEYRGNEGILRSYVDLERLFDTNLAGTDVFGGISTAVQGSTDLNPHLTEDTLLSTINGGEGLSRNAAISISINTGLTTVVNVVDLSGAVTIGDVARLIESAAPAGTTITAEVTGAGLALETTGVSIAVGEVAQGLAAHELGIFTSPSSPTSPTLTGDDLNPRILKTTRLENLLGTKAQGRLVSSGSNNDIVITAAQNGTSLNGVTVEFVGGGVAGSEVVTYDSFSSTLTVQIEAGFSTADQVAAAITANGLFNAVADYRDAASTTQAGTNAVDIANFPVITSGGSGEVLDTASGFILANGEQSVTLDISSLETVEDLLNSIKGSGLGLLAEINEAGNGINVRSRLSGADLTIGENGGTTATQLGIRTYTGATQLADFNRGIGVPTQEDPTNDDLLIKARDGTQLSINLSAAQTVQDVIDLINGHSANNVGTTAVLARLVAKGNGIELVDSSTTTTGAFIVQTVEGSQAAQYLGFVPDGQSQVSTSAPDGSGNFVLQSEDRHTLETDSVFNTLLRLRTALEEGSVEEISRAIGRLDNDLSRVNIAQAELGIRLQNLEVTDFKLQDENVQLTAALSREIDVDLVEAISNLQARQYAFEASLRTAANLLQVSLLNFI